MMAIACRIIGSTVQAPNGNVSKLFNSLKERFGEESAMKLYALTETIDYKDNLYNKDSNGEMTVPDFLKFALRDENPMELNKDNVDFLQRFDYNDINKLNSLYVNGVFQPTYENLMETGLFLEDEVYNIMYSKESQKALKNFIEHNEEFPVERVSDIRISENRYNMIGIRPLMDPMVVESEVLEELVGIETIEELDKAVDTLKYEEVIDRYKNDEGYREYLRDLVMNSAEIEVQEDTDGTVQLLMNTVDVSKIDDLSDTTRRIEQLTDKDMVVEEFEVVVDTLIDMGVEIQFDELYLYNKSIDELKTFSRVLGEFVSKPDMETTRALAEQIEQFTDRDSTKISRYNNNGRVSPRNLRSYNTTKSEVTVFEESSMVKHKGDTYLKVQDKYSTEQLYEALYNAVVKDPSIIGMDNLPSVEGDTKILENPINKEEVIQDIKDYILDRTKGLDFADTETQQKIEIYKAYYGSDTVTPQTNTIVAPHESDTYLMEEFVGDFNAERLRNMKEGTKEYEDFYKHFKVDQKGIGLINDNQFTKDIVMNTMPEAIREDLLRYSELSESIDLGLQQPNIDQTYRDRLEAQQNPEVVPELTSEYSIASADEIVTEDVGQFTKIRGEVYEKALEYKDKTLYKKLPKTEGLFKNVNIEQPFSDKSEVFLRDFVITKDNTVKYKKHMTKAEIAEVNEKHFACS